MKNMLVFEFDNNDRKIELRKDLLTSKGMGDNFSELDIRLVFFICINNF